MTEKNRYEKIKDFPDLVKDKEVPGVVIIFLHTKKQKKEQWMQEKNL